MSYEQLPKDIGGYQHVEHGPVKPGDIWVSRGNPASFVSAGSFKCAEEANEYGARMDMRLYRKMPVAGCRDDKALWGETAVDPTQDMGTALYAAAHAMDKTAAVAPQKEKFYIPQDDKSRKNAPLYRGLLGYFPAACFEVAAHSMESDQKHNPGNKEGPTWARDKSPDHLDCCMRHIIDAGKRGTPKRRYHLRANAWRALAALQEDCEADGYLPGISSR